PAGSHLRRPACRHHQEGDRRAERRQVNGGLSMAPGPGANASVRLADIAAAVGGELRGSQPDDAERRVERIGALEGATPQTISFLAQARLNHLLGSTEAGAVIVREDSAAAVLARGAVAIVVPD